MGAGAGLSNGRAEIRPAALGIRQEDRPRTGYRPSFGAGSREKIARSLPDKGKPLQEGASRRPFCVSERRLAVSRPASALYYATQQPPEDLDEPHRRQSCL